MKPAENIDGNNVTFKKIDPSNDPISRKNFIDKINPVIENIEEPYVIAMTSPWGTGKTTCIKEWHEKIGASNSFIFKSWETDFSQYPLLAFISEFFNHLGDDDTAFKELGDEAAKIGVSAAIGVFSGVLKKITGVDANAIKQAMEKYSPLDVYNEEKIAIKNFTAELKTRVNGIYEGTGRPYVVFVDELDRCRPEYAIQILECIKHFFDIPHLIFILAVDKNQIGRNINQVYGTQIADDYLRKFVDLTINMPIISEEEHVKYLLDKYDFDKNLFENIAEKNIGKMVLENASEIFKKFNLSLRAQNQFFMILDYSLRNVANKATESSKFYSYPYILLFLIALRIKDKGLYNEYVDYKADADYLFRKLGIKVDDSRLWLLMHMALTVSCIGIYEEEEVLKAQSRYPKEQHSLFDSFSDNHSWNNGYLDGLKFVLGYMDFK